MTDNKNKNVKMTVKLDEETHKKVKIKLIQEGLTFQDLMVSLIEKFVSESKIFKFRLIGEFVFVL